MPSAVAVPVHDPTRAALDAELPTLALALDPCRAQAELTRLPALAGATLEGIRVVRHKPGRRCLVAYDLHGVGTVYGKVQRRRYGKSGARLLASLRAAGLDGEQDGIGVPEPLGVVGAFRMWLQREEAGTSCAELLHRASLGARIAQAAHTLHVAGVPPERPEHGPQDEVRILEECLGRVAAERPRLASRLTWLLDRCARAARGLAGGTRCGIHRDFYADQVLVDGSRLTLVDFDLYCLGDPALDIGNFLGHVTEQALRTQGSPTAFAPFEEALAARFAELAGSDAARRVPAWTALTLARHVYLCTRFDDRRHLLEPLLELTGERLARAAA